MRGYRHGFGIKLPRFRFQLLCDFGQVLNFSVPQFPHPQGGGDGNTCLLELLLGFTGIKHSSPRHWRLASSLLWGAALCIVGC